MVTERFVRPAIRCLAAFAPHWPRTKGDASEGTIGDPAELGERVTFGTILAMFA